MRVSQIYVDAINALGKCDEATVFRRLSDAVRLLSNKGLFDPTVAFIDISMGVDGTITLPFEVGTVLAVNAGCRPTLLRDQWFQYHLNGVGTEMHTDCGYSDVLAQNVPVIRELEAPVKLVAKPERASDNNKVVRVFGWDVNGARIYSVEAGVTVDGFLVPLVFGFPAVNANAPAIGKIDRVQKDKTNGYVELVGVNPLVPATELYRLGYYQPVETDPSYRRLRVSAPNGTMNVRIAYKKNDTEIRSQDDWINLDNREAILLAIKAVKFREANNFDQARAAENEAQRILNEEAESRKPATSLSAPQVIRTDEWSSGAEGMFY
jgi:hypothetical protein